MRSREDAIGLPHPAAALASVRKVRRRPPLAYPSLDVVEFAHEPIIEPLKERRRTVGRNAHWIGVRDRGRIVRADMQRRPGPPGPTQVDLGPDSDVEPPATGMNQHVGAPGAAVDVGVDLLSSIDRVLKSMEELRRMSRHQAGPDESLLLPGPSRRDDRVG